MYTKRPLYSPPPPSSALSPKLFTFQKADPDSLTEHFLVLSQYLVYISVCIENLAEQATSAARNRPW